MSAHGFELKYCVVREFRAKLRVKCKMLMISKKEE